MNHRYNAGHLIEAALAHNTLFHNDKLLGPIQRYADLLCALFGPGAAQTHGYPGHPEIELALLRLAERSKNERTESFQNTFYMNVAIQLGARNVIFMM
jgi:DUF1680 family protein